MTPELPRAPRSRAPAVMEAAWPTEEAPPLRSSAAAVPMVRLMLVPVSPSGTGKTLRSLICCFCSVMAAAPWSTTCPNWVPLIESVISRYTPLELDTI